MSKHRANFKKWYNAKRSHKIIAWVVGVMVALYILGSLNSPEEEKVKPINQGPTTSAPKVETKVVTKTKVDYPDSCVQMTQLTEVLSNLARDLASAPDDVQVIVSDIRKADARDDNNGMIAGSNKLNDISEAYDETVDTILTVERNLDKAAMQCNSDLK